MDPVLDGIKKRRAELKEELKRLDRTEQAYKGKSPSASTFLLTDTHKGDIVDYVRKQAGELGVRALDVAQALDLPNDPVRNWMRKSRQFKQTNTGNRNQRFRLNTDDKPKAVISGTRNAEVKIPKPEPVRKGEGTGAAMKEVQSANRDKVRKCAENTQFLTVPAIAARTGLSNAAVKDHLQALVEAEVLADRGVRSEFRQTGRSPIVYESLIFEGPKVNISKGTPNRKMERMSERKPVTIRPGEGISGT